jgi:hypothetical protein
MKTKILSFSATDEYAKLIEARKRAEGMTGSEYFRKCVREEVERAAARKMLALGNGSGMDMKTLLAAVA